MMLDDDIFKNNKFCCYINALGYFQCIEMG